MEASAMCPEGAKRRIPEYDIIKGISILLVSIIHTGHPVYFMEYGFLFAFFFVSGCTFKYRGIGAFLKAKLLRIYIPFVLANLTGWFVGRLYYGLSGYGGYGYSLKEAIGRALSFQIAENLMSPTWFLLPLFLVSFLFYFLYRAFMKVKYRDELLLGGAFVIFLLGLHFRQALAVIVYNRCSVISTSVYALFFYALGYYYHNHRELSKKIVSGRYSPEVFALSILLLNEIWNHSGYTLNVRYGEMSSGWITVAVSVPGVFVIVYLAGCMARTHLLQRVFCLLGRHSLAIMLFHVVCYGVVTIMLHYIMGWDYPVTWAFGYYSEKISYLNALAGVLIPVAAAEGWQRLKLNILK